MIFACYRKCKDRAPAVNYLFDSCFLRLRIYNHSKRAGVSKSSFFLFHPRSLVFKNTKNCVYLIFAILNFMGL
jgi:hypothetical protein